MSEFCIMRIKYKKGISKEKLNEIETKFYQDNIEFIEGMACEQFANELVFKEFIKLYKKWACQSSNSEGDKNE